MMEGLQEMRDSEGPGKRFEFKEYVSDEAKVFLAEVDAERKRKKKALKAARA
jgi:putative component of toxin-antitoxin plasmid stabilization module